MAKFKITPKKMIEVPAEYTITLTDADCDDLLTDFMVFRANGQKFREITNKLESFLGNRNSGGYRDEA